MSSDFKIASIFSKIYKMRSIVTFLQEAKAEFRRVTWPSQAKTTRLTVAVLAVTVGMALLVASFDYLFNLMIQISVR